MREIGTYLAGAIMALCVGLPGLAQAAPCGLNRVAAVKIGKSPSGAPTVPVTIAGKQFQFTLGLNSSDPFIGQHVLKALHLQDQPLPSPYFTNGAQFYYGTERSAATRVTDYVKLSETRIGNAEFKTFKALERPISAALQAKMADGDLGQELLSRYDVDIDLKTHRLNLFLQDHCPGQVVYWATQYGVVPFRISAMSEIYFDGIVDGRVVTMALDPTRSNSWIGMVDAHDLIGIDPKDPKLVQINSATRSSKSVFHYPFNRLSLGGIVIKNPDIYIVPQTSDERCRKPLKNPDRMPRLAFKTRSEMVATFWCLLPAQLHLGRSALRKLHLYFAFKEKNLYVTAADAGNIAKTP